MLFEWYLKCNTNVNVPNVHINPCSDFKHDNNMKTN